MSTIPTSKEGLRKRMMGFLRQRKRFSELALKKTKSRGLMQIMLISSALIIKFNLIQNYHYWRHCREVANQAEQLYEILPSETGKQVKIREEMITLIAECKAVSAMSCQDYHRVLRMS